jgi:hypothetical protein
MEEQQKRWIAHVTGHPDEGSGMSVWCTWGTLTPCGQWVEQEYQRPPPARTERVRHQVDAYWCETPIQAKAMKADKLERLGLRLIEQAAELRAAAEAERVVS